MVVSLTVLILFLAAVTLLVYLLSTMVVRFRTRIHRNASELEREQKKVEREAERAAKRQARDEYLDSLDHITFFQGLIIFTVSSVGGLIIETLWVRYDMGIWQSRYGMVWGPFSPLYGVGTVLLTILLWRLRKQPVWVIFLASSILGTLLEQLTGMILDDFAHVTSWSYLHLPDSITKYVSLRMTFFWGLLGTVWCELLMPEIVYRIGPSPKKPVYIVLTVLLTMYLTLDSVMTVAVALRRVDRNAGIPATNPVAQLIDDHYNDEFIENRFENVEYENS